MIVKNGTICFVEELQTNSSQIDIIQGVIIIFFLLLIVNSCYFEYLEDGVFGTYSTTYVSEETIINVNDTASLDFSNTTIMGTIYSFDSANVAFSSLSLLGGLFSSSSLPVIVYWTATFEVCFFFFLFSLHFSFFFLFLSVRQLK